MLYDFLFHVHFNKHVFTVCISSDALPKKISLHPYTTITDVGQKDLDIQYIMTHYEQLTPVALKQQMMI
jgi:hypothetical protein